MSQVSAVPLSLRVNVKTQDSLGIAHGQNGQGCFVLWRSRLMILPRPRPI